MSAAAFKINTPIPANLDVSQLCKEYQLKVSSISGQKTIELVKKPSKITGFISGLFQSNPSINISDEELAKAIRASANNVRYEKIPEISGSKEFQKFARRIKGVESIKTKFQRAKAKLKLLTSGSGKLAKQGMQGKVLHESYWQEALLEHHPYGEGLEKIFNAWKGDQTTHLSFEDWLECSKKSNGYKVKYLNPHEKQEYVLSFRDGKVFKGEEAFNTLFEEAGDQIGAAMFVIGPDEHLYAGSHAIGRFHHSSFLGGQAVLGAGDFRTDRNGKILEISNLSGHYRTGTEQLLNTLRILRKNDVDLTDIKVFVRQPEGFLYSYNSAKAYLDANGMCIYDGCDCFELTRDGNKIVHLTCTNSHLGKVDICATLSKLVKTLKLDPNFVRFSQKDSRGNLTHYSSATAFLTDQNPVNTVANS